MTMPTVTYNGTAPISQITNRPVSVAIGPYEVRTAPPPPPKGKGLSTFGHYKRPDAEPARRGAYRTLEKAGMLPVIKPDDIGRSQISQAAPLQRGIFGSLYDSIVGALEPMTSKKGRPNQEQPHERRPRPWPRRPRRARPWPICGTLLPANSCVNMDRTSPAWVLPQTSGAN